MMDEKKKKKKERKKRSVAELGGRGTGVFFGGVVVVHMTGVVRPWYYRC